MNLLPESKATLLIRADFSDDAAWSAVRRAAMAENDEGFKAYLECIDDKAYDGVTANRLVELAESGHHAFVFVADRLTLTDAEMPVLVVDLREKPGRTFRIVPSEMWAVENNMSVDNMSWEDFADDVGPVGVYRG